MLFVLALSTSVPASPPFLDTRLLLSCCCAPRSAPLLLLLFLLSFPSLPLASLSQVTLLASGRLMYHGLRDNMVPWFATQGYSYDPTQHGVASDWALDLVAIGFHKPKRFYGHTITSLEQLQHASNVFVSSYTTDPNLIPFQGGPESMIGQRSLSQKVQARMQQLVGVRRATDVCTNAAAMRSIGGASSCASYDASSTCSSNGGLQGDLKFMDSKDVAIISDLAHAQVSGMCAR